MLRYWGVAVTLILGTPQVTSAVAASWAQRNGAPDWFAALARVYWDLGPARGGVRPEVGFAQFAKETGFGHFGGTDPVFSATEAMHNPCGMKNSAATATETFPDWWTGITAHLDHLALYAGAVGYPRVGSPDTRPFPYLHGICPTVEDLSGHWAPASDYGSTLVADFLTPMLREAPVTICPFATWRGPVPNTGGAIGTARLGVVHIMQGTLDGTDGWFHNPAAQVSAHFGNGKDGRLYQWVDTGSVAWAEMNYNGVAISIENEGNSGDSLTAQQVANLERLIPWIEQNCGVPMVRITDPNGSGWIGHGELGVPGGNHPDCPGAPVLAQLPGILAAANGTPTPTPSPTPAPPPVPTDYEELLSMGTLPTGCTDNEAINAFIRSTWNTYHVDPMTASDQGILLWCFRLPAGTKGSLAGSANLLIAEIVDSAAASGRLRPSMAGSV